MKNADKCGATRGRTVDYFRQDGLNAETKKPKIIEPLANHLHQLALAQNVVDEKQEIILRITTPSTEMLPLP